LYFVNNINIKVIEQIVRLLNIKLNKYLICNYINLVVFCLLFLLSLRFVTICLYNKTKYNNNACLLFAIVENFIILN